MFTKLFENNIGTTTTLTNITAGITTSPTVAHTLAINPLILSKT